jgi:hypothetical protein
LKNVTKAVRIRVREIDQRPIKINELKEALNMTETFLQAARLFHSKKDDEEKPITDGETSSLEKMMKETYVSKEGHDVHFICYDFQGLARSGDAGI